MIQLVDMFLGEKWSEYINEYPSLPERHRHVPPYMVHSLLTRSVTVVCVLSLPPSPVCVGN